jgi:biotin carboxyl carrier protein
MGDVKEPAVTAAAVAAAKQRAEEARAASNAAAEAAGKAQELAHALEHQDRMRAQQTPVKVPVAGRVDHVETTDQGGLRVQVAGADGQRYNFGHLQRIEVQDGDSVAVGQIIGWV